ncbi:sensor domain-containing diguanylate cyclase [Megalodesulfovibrio gigas]|uniref:Putative GGDEF domain protein n=1 Tax=Megalodesulfovibrio gigas (strain ATCC 19364 / DSM 1382 / NCIMB 9332 / VKM B-1759) TaxID=1121448 RepID=T2G9P1_MEGG1|nr:sensor domain-containing diguanylate cyclase [Megalodesulfovibrio gigas]AGW12899.1 putative GGDEF domain protein [Megalodesulfovibrio gigas DSM 1382 = ATCC 19364]
MSLDLTTLLVMNLVICSVSVLGITVIWLQNRQRYAGITCWLASIALQAVGLGVLLLGHTPLSAGLALAAGVCLTGGGLLLLVGLERFLECPAPRAQRQGLFGVLAACLVALAYFGVAGAAGHGQQLSMALASLVIDGHIAWLLLVRTPPELRPATRVAGLVVCGYLTAGLLRLGLHTLPLPFLHAVRDTNVVDVVSTVAYTVLGVCLTLSLVLMVNRRLLLDVTRQEQTFSKTFHLAPYGLMLTRAKDGRVLEVNQSFARMLGTTSQALLGKTTLELKLLDSPEARARMLEPLVRGEGIAGQEVQFKTTGGEPKTGLLYADTLRLGNTDCILTSVADVTELSNAKRELEILATHDALTGLPNRMLLYDRFAQCRARTARHGGKLAVMSLDLDSFKDINDRLGHHAGDAVLKEAARRLAAVIRTEDTASRFGGDEFVLLLGDLTSPGDADHAAAKVVQALNMPVEVDGCAVAISASVGVALYPDHGEDIDTLLRRSDEALYWVKTRGRNGHALYATDTPPLPDLSAGCR